MARGFLHALTQIQREAERAQKALERQIVAEQRQQTILILQHQILFLEKWE